MSERKVSLDELSKHASADDLWVALNGKVYDLTKYLSSHPGGMAMLRQAGKDGTLGFKSISAHSTVSDHISNLLEGMLVGTLESTTLT